jgi:hypothetical protein
MWAGFLSVSRSDHGLLINPDHGGSISDCPTPPWDDLRVICGILIWCITLLITLYRSDHVIGSAGVHDRPMETWDDLSGAVSPLIAGFVLRCSYDLFKAKLEYDIGRNVRCG